MCLNGALCIVPFTLICNITTFNKKSFDLLTIAPAVGMCVRTEYVFAWCSLLNSH